MSRLSDALSCIAVHGFTGVEFAEAPHELPPPEQVIALLRRFNLELLGICGGGILEKAQFLEAMKPYWLPRLEGQPTPYVYVEEWDADTQPARERGLQVAVHLHYPMLMSNIAEDLKKHKNLQWLPDTAHLKIGGANVVKSVLDHADRLAAVHLKDWTDRFGRTSYRYAKGFAELGQGDLKEELPAVLHGLEKLNYAGWVVVELDYPKSAEAESVKASSDWLIGQGFKSGPPGKPCSASKSMESGVDFFTEITRFASYGDPGFYEHAAELLRRHLNCANVGIWAYHQAGKTFSVLANAPANTDFTRDTFHIGIAFSSICLQLRASQEFDLMDAALHEKYPLLAAYRHSQGVEADYTKWAREKGFDRFECVPVFNIYNPNQVRFFLHLLYSPGQRADPQISVTATARRFSRAAEIALTEKCLTAARETNQLVAENRDIAGLERALIDLVTKHLHCEGATIFHLDPSGRLIAGATTGLKWNPQLQPFEQFYTKNDGSVTARLLSDQQPLLLRNAESSRATLGARAKWRSSEIVPPDHPDTCLLVPYFGRRWQLLGVVRCRNRVCGKGDVRPFSEDDLVLLEAIFQTCSPDVDLLSAEKNRGLALSGLFHELAQPLASLKSAIFMVDDELQRTNRALQEDYLGDAKSWIALAERLLNGFDFLNWQQNDPHVERTLVWPIKDVIAPAVRQVQSLLWQRGFAERSINYAGTDQSEIKNFPPLFVDINMFQQVVFNLLTNAIKYAGPNSREFRVEIRAATTGKSNLLYFRDWGRGIPHEWRDAIFQEGVRVDGVSKAHVPGRGLGLWVVNKIVKLHGGTITLTRHQGPTEFTITLPRMRGPKNVEEVHP